MIGLPTEGRKETEPVSGLVAFASVSRVVVNCKMGSEWFRPSVRGVPAELADSGLKLRPGSTPLFRLLVDVAGIDDLSIPPRFATHRPSTQPGRMATRCYANIDPVLPGFWFRRNSSLSQRTGLTPLRPFPAECPSTERVE